jgi:HEAT repeat protein
LRALSEFDHPEVKPLLAAGLHDSEVEIQTCAALALRHHPSEAAIPSLVTLLGHPESLLSRVAGDALIAVGKTAATPLIELLEEHSGNSHLANVEAVRVLAEIGDPSSIPTLFHAFQEGTSMMQYWAEKGLEKVGIGMVFFDPY